MILWLGVGQIQTGEFPVIPKSADPIVGGAITFIGMALIAQLENQVHHIVDMFCRTGCHIGFLDAKCFHVFQEGLYVAIGILRDGNTCFSCVPDDLVIHVGNVHDM